MANEVQIFSVPEMQTMAQSVARSGLFGMNESQAFTMMLIAQSEGIHPIKAVQRYNIVLGKPSMKSDAMLADFQAAGGTVEWLTESDDKEKCEALFKHPRHCPLGKTIRFSMVDAKAAGLTTKDNWKNYPPAMMRARVVSIGVRMLMPGIVAGLYTPEEVQDMGPTIDITPRPALENHTPGQSAPTRPDFGALAPPETEEAYQDFINENVANANSKWLDHITDEGGEILSGVDGTIADTRELSGHMLKWARSMGWAKAPQEIPIGERDRYAAVAWAHHEAEFQEEARRYLRGKWAAARKGAKARKPTGKRETPEVLELQAEGEALDELLTTEAGARG